MSQISHVTVVIPGHDEEEHIAACLASVRRALRHPKLTNLESRIVVVADRCADGTARRARQSLAGGAGRRGRVLEVSFRNVGQARRAGVAEALSRWARVDPASVWLANTDADTLVPGTWLVRQLLAARMGYAAVAGTVDVHVFPGQHPSVPGRFRATYVVPLERPHSHVHGCNLGVRADAYLDAGGWPSVGLAEDHGLWNALRGRGWRCFSDRRLQVVTSGRAAGRAVGGFANALVRLADVS